jgi:galactokinase
MSTGTSTNSSTSGSAGNNTAVQAFRELVGSDPLGTWSAPGRANLIGEHTDYNEGFVLPFAIDRRTTVAASPRTDSRIRIATTFSPDIADVDLRTLNAAVAAGEITGWAAYPLGVAWALGQLGADLDNVTGVDIVIDSDVPVGAGLSSSAAIECAVAVALRDLWNLDLTERQLALIGQRAENEVVGAPTGIMDQSASLLGRSDAAVFLDCRTLESDVIPLGLEAADLAIMLIDTRVEHAHASGGYRERRASCELGAHTLGVAALRDLTVDDLPRAHELLDEVTFRRVRHIVTENARVLDTVEALRAGGPLAIGSLLTASHASMRDDFEISVPELDLAVETAIANGAVGARMTGGGFGGSALAVVPRDRVSAIEQAVHEAFSAHGYTSPTTFTVQPSDGARRDDS